MSFRPSRIFRDLTVIFSLVLLAGNTSPIDVLSHIPVCCEDNGNVYAYFPQKQALGNAANTKRPTSVLMLLENPSDEKYTKELEAIKVSIATLPQQ